MAVEWRNGRGKSRWQPAVESGERRRERDRIAKDNERNET